MTNYAACLIQPLVNGVISIVGGAPVFSGRGVAPGPTGIVRTPGGAMLGDFTLTLDPGLPGAVELDEALAKSMLTQRGTLGALPGGTTITQQAVSYPSARTVRVVTSIASAPTDPNALEIVVWRTN